MTLVYAIMLTVAAALAVLYCTLIKKKEAWLLVLYACVFTVNLGYLLLSVSKTVGFALLSIKITYLGQIFLITSMYLTIVKLCGFCLHRNFKILLCTLDMLMLAAVCTAGYLPWYYKDLTLVFENGAARLIKDYGPLHTVYLIFILLYFAAMIVTIALSMHRRMAASHKHAGLCAAVVLCNIAMWIVEKIVPLNFEFLSVSYILSECVFFFFYWMMQDYVPIKDAPKGEQTSVIFASSEESAQRMRAVLDRLPKDVCLSGRQLDILTGILDGKSRKEIAADLHLSENTVKMHTSSLYRVLGVASRDDIYAMIK